MRSMSDRSWILRCFVALALSTLAGCDVGRVEDVTVIPKFPPESIAPPSNPGLDCDRNSCDKIVRVGEPAEIIVDGKGKCESFTLLAGDGRAPVESGPIDFDRTRWRTTISYPPSTTWLGRKKIWAINSRQCANRASEIVHVMKPGVADTSVAARSVSVGIPAPQNTACRTPPNMPPIRAGSIVSIVENGSNTINFGCPFNGCVWGIGGNPAGSAPASMPFPGLRWHSLVLRVDYVAYQGGSGATFVVQKTGQLEFCMNDDILTDNTGAWSFFVSVDETDVQTPY